jgi:hypothetical protein
MDGARAWDRGEMDVRLRGIGLPPLEALGPPFEAYPGTTNAGTGIPAKAHMRPTTQQSTNTIIRCILADGKRIVINYVQFL